MDPRRRVNPVEWPTVLLIAATYAAWVGVTVHGSALTPWLAVPLLTLILTMHSSLQHEAIHGHPFAAKWIGAWIMTPGLGVLIPYGRFRDLHLAHHKDANLTDPYDDPESWYHHPTDHARLPLWIRTVLYVNNTLLGRLVLGPIVGLEAFLRTERRRIVRRDWSVIRAWVIHLATVVAVILWLLGPGTMPIWAYVLATYLALSVLKIRTFVEHQAHELASGRSVIIEDRGPLAFLFLNNNLHSVHHAHPQVAWYDLPALYAARRDVYLRRNRGYVFPSYLAVARRFFLRPKDPVPHPFAGGSE